MRLAINEDAEKTYTPTRALEYPDKLSYLNKVKLDLIEMLIGVKIMYENSHRIHIYPGKMPIILSYLQPYLFPEMTFVNLFIKYKK